MSFVRVPPDSTGKKVYTVEQTIGSDVVQTQVVHVADKKYPDQFQAIDKRGAASTRFAEGQPIMSGFGSLKTAHQRALGVYESSLDTYSDLFTTVETNGGLLSYTPQESSEVLSVTNNPGSRVVTTTNRYHYYLPGTSNFVNMTVACGDTGKVNNIRRWGAFDANDGIFFELNGTTLYAVIRSSVTGVVTETKVAQQDWNFDTVDGAGWSGHVLDITKINVWWMDYQWLGAGRVRFGIFEPNGSRLVCHEFRNAGQLVLPYMRTGTLPLGAENINTGTVSSGSEMRLVCMAIYAEGTYEDYTFWRKADLEVGGVLIDQPEKYVMGVRAKPTINGKHNSVQSYPESLNIYTDHPIAVTFWQNVSLSSDTWNLSTDSSLEGDTEGVLDVTNATRFKTIFFGPGAHHYDLTEYFELNDEGIMALPGGASEIWAFTVKNLSASQATTTLGLNHKELW